MSRSYRKTSIIGNTGSSEKMDKIIAHRKSRKYIKDHITATHGNLELLEEMMMPKDDEISVIRKIKGALRSAFLY